MGSSHNRGYSDRLILSFSIYSCPVQYLPECLVYFIPTIRKPNNHTGNYIDLQHKEDIWKMIKMKKTIMKKKDLRNRDVLMLMTYSQINQPKGWGFKEL